MSPFNSRDGSYSLVATDPAFPQTEGQGSVKNLITLRAGEGPVKLTASVFSERPSLDPASMTMLESLRFVALWWWVGLLTFPRIVGQAGRLFLKRRLGMRVYWRPEVKVKSIAREETPVERLAKDMLSRRRATADDTPRILERFFKGFLQDKIASLDIPLVVNYKSGLRNEDGRETFSSPSVLKQPVDTEVVDITVLDACLLRSLRALRGHHGSLPQGDALPRRGEQDDRRLEA